MNSAIKQAEKKHEQALALYGSKKYEHAIYLFNEAIKLNTKVPEYWNNRAACYIMLKDYYKALNDARKSIDIDETYTNGYKRLSRCNIILDDLNFALKYIQKAQELDPSDEYCKKEIEKVKKLIEYDDNITKYFNENKFNETLKMINEYLTFVPHSKKFMLLRAECLILLQKYESGASIIKPLLKTMPQDDDILYVKALYDYYKDYITKSFESLQNIKKHIPDNLKISQLYRNAKKTLEILHLVNERKDEKNLTDAYILLDEAIKIDPKNHTTNKHLLYQKITLATECKELKNNLIKDCNNYLKKYNENVDILKIRAREHMAIQNYEEAIDDYEAILKLEISRHDKKLLDIAKLHFSDQLKNNYKILKIETNEKDQIKIKRAYQELNINYVSELENEDDQNKIIKINKKIERVTKAYNEIMKNVNDNENENLLEEVTEKVQRLIVSQDFSKASTLIEKISKNDPNNTESIYMQICLIYSENYILESIDVIKKKYEQAPNIEKIQKLYEKAQETYFLVTNARECLKKNNPNEAYKLLTTAQKIDEDQVTTNKKIQEEKIEIEANYPEFFDNVYKNCSLYLDKYGYDTKIMKIRAYHSLKIKEYEDTMEDFAELYKIECNDEFKKMYEETKVLFDKENANMYKILRIDENINDENIIRKAFHNLLFLYHADKNSWATKERKAKLDKKLIRVREAYNEISKLVKRKPE